MEEILNHFNYELAEFIKPYYGSPIIDEIIELKLNIGSWLLSRKQQINDYYWTRNKENKLSIMYSYKSFKVRFIFLPNCEFHVYIEHSRSRTVKIEDKNVRDSFYADPGYVYFIESKFGWKIGKTRNLDNRKKTFDVKLPFKFALRRFVKSHNITKLEIEFHDYFKNKKLNGEWYLVTEDDICNCINITHPELKLRYYNPDKKISIEQWYLTDIREVRSVKNV